MTNSIKGIVLDAFGTVIRPVSRNGAYQAVLSKATNFRLARNLALKENLTITELAQKLNLEPPSADILRDLAHEVEHLECFPDVYPFLQSAEDCGLKIAICSNLAQAYGNRTRGLLQNVDTFVFSYEIGAVKPEPIIYKKVCDALDLPPENLLFIGDTPLADFDGPKAFGMEARLIKRMNGQTLNDVFEIAKSVNLE